MRDDVLDDHILRLAGLRGVTRMLVRIADAREAAEAAEAGVDAVELPIKGHGTDLATARAVRAAFPGALRLSVGSPSLTPELVTAAASVDADEIAIAIDAMPSPIPVVDAALPPSLTAVAKVAASTDVLETIQRARDRVGALMIHAGRDDTDGDVRLVDSPGIAQLDIFAASCREAGLSFGLAGGLEAPDVARLLLLEPDVLGFDATVRMDHHADGLLNRAALDAIRALIPREGQSSAVSEKPTATVTDRIFVRDFITSLSIGAYQAEVGTRQRVRFSIEADVVREAALPRDMRDVFSYDIIIETIRVLAQRAHVTFVETLAEEIAASLLAHAGVIAITVKVEKLDVIDGAVGIEISRRRPA